MSELSDQIRKSFKEADDIRDAGLATPEDIVRYDDIVYGEDPIWQSLDVYRPRNAGDRLLPVIVSVHGGGWVYGDKERYQYYCMSLAQRGFAVVNFSYRLAPENLFPAPLEDTNSVFAWILSHGEEYRMDREHIFGVGDSAGAHILGLYCAACTDPAYGAAYPFRIPENFAPKAVAFNCGAYNIRRAYGGGDASLTAEYLPEGGSPREEALLDVPEHITSRYPAVFLMTSSGDFLKQQALTMAAKLTEQNVPFAYHFYGDAQHLLGHVFHCDMRLEDARLCNDEECGFFRRFLEQ